MRISSTGKKHSEETKIKMSLDRMGNKHRLGIPHSNEIKEKISKAGIGRKISKMHKEILREKRTRIILDTNSFVFYLGLKEISDLYGINYSVLANNLNGTNKVNKTHFIYV